MVLWNESVRFCLEMRLSNWMWCFEAARIYSSDQLQKPAQKVLVVPISQWIDVYTPDFTMHFENSEAVRSDEVCIRILALENDGLVRADLIVPLLFRIQEWGWQFVEGLLWIVAIEEEIFFNLRDVLVLLPRSVHVWWISAARWSGQRHMVGPRRDGQGSA